LSIARLIAVSAGLTALALLLFWATQRRMIYFPFGDVPPPAQVGLRDARSVTFPTEDGLTLNGWFVPARAPATGDVVIVFNGNAGNRAYRADIARALADRGIAALLFDYRGYGGNAGAPTEEGLTNDARAARRFVESSTGVDARLISYFGESLGAGVAVGLALERPPRALVLRSPFTSLTDVGRHHYPYLPVRWLLRDKYPSLDRISRIASPVLVITAAHDSIVPTEQSRRLFEAAREPKRLLVLEGVDHNDEALVAGGTVIEAVTSFLLAAR
jgi:uncharacterized protein